MKELVRTNDLIKLSWMRALLADSGIESFVLDHYTSVLEGSAAAIPRRLMVADEDYDAAVRALSDAGEAREVR